jgi:serine/threonine protein kinase
MSHRPPEEEYWARVEALCLEALERPVSERGAFLDQSCGRDSALRREVDALLEGHESGGGVPELAETAPDGDTLPERIANYRILRRLGEGGMGVVLLAVREGEGFEQTVALKVIRGNIADQLLTRRLEEERRLLAGLEHPGIARLIDGGVTAEGQPFYAMEYIEGTDLLAWCRSRQSGIEERLRVFIDVCDAVHHAHQQLIVHRDLKPSNILVTPAGRTKLLDFGIATSLAHQVGQEVSQHWVTPAYASPEQVNGRPVSTLSDVYALGVLLCELLTGTRPHDTTAGSPAELPRPQYQYRENAIRVIYGHSVNAEN